MLYLVYIMDNGLKWYVAAHTFYLGRLHLALTVPEERWRAKRITSETNAILCRDRLRRAGYDAHIEEWVRGGRNDAITERAADA